MTTEGGAAAPRNGGHDLELRHAKVGALHGAPGGPVDEEDVRATSWAGWPMAAASPERQCLPRTRRLAHLVGDEVGVDVHRVQMSTPEPDPDDADVDLLTR